MFIKQDETLLFFCFDFDVSASLCVQVSFFLASRKKRLRAAPHGGSSPSSSPVLCHFISVSAPPERCEGLIGAFPMLIIKKGKWINWFYLREGKKKHVNTSAACSDAAQLVLMCGENFPPLLCRGFKWQSIDALIQPLFCSVVQNRIFEDFCFFFSSHKDVSAWASFPKTAHLENLNSRNGSYY